MEDQIAGYIIIVLAAGVFWTIKSWSKDVQRKKAQKKDVNITFKKGISLEKKQYPAMKDDFGERTEMSTGIYHPDDEGWVKSWDVKPKKGE